MAMIDLNDLERYIVISTGDEAPGEVDDLRELEGDFGHGVYPLWSDGLQSIVAFAFEPALFDEEEARAWVKKAMEKKPAEMSLTDIVQAVAAPILRAISAKFGRDTEGMGLRSFDELRRLVGQALDERYGIVNQQGMKEGPWIVDMGTSAAIIELEGQRYTVTYQVDESDVVTLGKLTPVEQEWVRKADGSPVMLHAFAVRLGPGDEAEDDEADGLVWKELIHPGKWFKTDTGRIVEITAEIIKEVFRAWKAGLPKLISVPVDHHHVGAGGSVPPTSNRGFVDKLKLIGDRLFGGFRFTDPEVAYGVQVGNIADSSVFLYPNPIHPETGEKFKWELAHVLLTNDPLVQDLGPFGAVPASASGAEGGYIVQSYRQQEVDKMKDKDKGQPESLPARQQAGLTLSAEDTTVYQEFQGLGLSVAEVQAMAGERDQVRQRMRDLEITRVVRALEGVEEHRGVTQVEGTRHWPVVCAAVETALKERPGPDALALNVDDEGQTGLDAVVLEIVNALPAEARMALAAQPAGSKDPQDPTLQEGDQEPTEEQIDELVTRL